MRYGVRCEHCGYVFVTSPPAVIYAKVLCEIDRNRDVLGCGQWTTFRGPKMRWAVLKRVWMPA